MLVDAEDIVIAEGLEKRFGSTMALDGADLRVARGTVVGLLGPNGAGKTTMVRILATVTRPTGGHATVAGLDVVAQAQQVRHTVALAGQFAAVDEKLTGRENLRIFCELYHLGGRQARRRADELLERFSLTEAGNRLVSTYSGGMRRRLDLASSLIVAPQLLLLDEPTTGLDPRGRIEMWDSVKQLAEDGTTVLLTTQYLDEADHLADRIVVIDHGRVIAEGSPGELKSRAGSDLLQVVAQNAADVDAIAAHLHQLTGLEPGIDRPERTVSVALRGGFGALAEVIRELDRADVPIADLTVRRATLDDVFLQLTGRTAAGADPGGADEAAEVQDADLDGAETRAQADDEAQEADDSASEDSAAEDSASDDGASDDSAAVAEVTR
jgi:ABC-2 type transport system ATP-binding protein